jgi:hypothetical protein
VWGSGFTLKDAAQHRGVIVMLMPLFAVALVVRRRFIVAPSTAPALTEFETECCSKSGAIGKSTKFRLEWKWPVMGPN